MSSVQPDKAAQSEQARELNNLTPEEGDEDSRNVNIP